MIQVIYASAATNPFTPELLKTLLAKARTRNCLYSITGMLLYHSSSFLQVLEGPEPQIQTILASIYKDPRHVNPRTLSQQAIKTREFQSWSMGFVDTTFAVTHPVGHVDYHRSLPALTESATCARRFLRFFQEGLYRQQPIASL